MVSKKPIAVIIHGTDGYPNENWFPWLKKELGKMGFEAIVPKFPTPKGQSLQNWERAFAKFKKRLGKNSIIIGHSMGAGFALRAIEKLEVKIKAAYLVAGFTGKLGIKRFDSLNKTFFARKFNWKKIRESCGKFVVISSSNDPYVKPAKGIALAKNLKVKNTIIEGAGHFNSAAGYKKFNELLEKIKQAQ